MKDLDAETHLQFTGLTGEEKSFRECLAAIVTNLPHRGDDDDDDDQVGRAVGIATRNFPLARFAVRGMVARQAKRDFFDRPCAWRRPTTKSERERKERQKVTSALRFKVMQRDGFRCKYCGVHVDNLPEGQRLVVDHVVAICSGGKSKPGNLVTACSECNNGKFTKPTNRFENSCQ